MCRLNHVTCSSDKQAIERFIPTTSPPTVFLQKPRKLIPPSPISIDRERNHPQRVRKVTNLFVVLALVNLPPFNRAGPRYSRGHSKRTNVYHNLPEVISALEMIEPICRGSLANAKGSLRYRTWNCGCGCVSHVIEFRPLTLVLLTNPPGFSTYGASGGVKREEY